MFESLCLSDYLEFIYIEFLYYTMEHVTNEEDLKSFPLAWPDNAVMYEENINK